MNEPITAIRRAMLYAQAKRSSKQAAEAATIANAAAGEAKQRVRLSALALLGLVRGQPAAVKVNTNIYHGTLMDVRIQIYPPAEGERLETAHLYGIVYGDTRTHNGTLLVEVPEEGRKALRAYLELRADEGAAPE